MTIHNKILLLTDEIDDIEKPTLMIRGVKYTQPFSIKILRCSENDKSSTGELFVNGIFICHTLELPWQNNQSYISSIPVGKYNAFVRYDKSDKWRIQLLDVPGRPGIQIHVGNFPNEIQGCVLVGIEVDNKNNMISESQTAYIKLKECFYGSSTPNLTPDYKIEVEISYSVGRTEFKSTGEDHKFLYASQAQWLEYYPDQAPNNWIETKRDLTYIYIKDPAVSFHIRIPLHGGHTEATTPGGSYYRSEYSYARKN